MEHIEFENKIMNMMLEGNEPIMQCFREQFKHATMKTRDFTGIGFFTEYEVPNEYRIENVHGHLGNFLGFPSGGDPEEFYDFILWINDGKIDTLEGKALNNWIENYDAVKFEYSDRDKFIDLDDIPNGMK